MHSAMRFNQYGKDAPYSKIRCWRDLQALLRDGLRVKEKALFPGPDVRLLAGNERRGYGMMEGCDLVPNACIDPHESYSGADV